jgi:homogentisate 1,2-dioxygenase
VTYYQRRGTIPARRHTRLRDSGGRLCYEELIGEEGFVSDSALLYHRHVPAALTGARRWDLPEQRTTPNAPLLPRHLLLHELFKDADSADAVTGRRLVLGNEDVRISYVQASEPSPLYRNATGDECVYVESGSATVETAFGPLEARGGDYVILPRSVTHRWVPGPGGLRAYCIEASAHIRPPRRYMSAAGQLLEHAPYCERDLRGPGEPVTVDGGETEVYVKHRDANGIAGTVHMVPRHPFDAVGWDGCLYPFTFNIADFMPVTGKVHQPPPVHQVFESTGFVICNFVPRKVDYHPESIPVPYYHSNVDSDEVMFYCGGDYEARKGSGISQGSVTLHPGGHPHGPQPGAYERSMGTEFFDELAVMVDTCRPLGLGEGAAACDDGRYAWSWSADAHDGAPPT